MTGAEKVDTGRWRQSLLCGKHHIHQIPVLVPFHERYDRTDWAETEPQFADLPSRVRSQVQKPPSLDRSGYRSIGSEMFPAARAIEADMDAVLAGRAEVEKLLGAPPGRKDPGDAE